MGGSFGEETGVQSYERIIRSARRKLRNNEATRRSWRKSFWNSCFGRRFQAIVSVIAVKIQFSSPSIVRRSFSWPGTLVGLERLTLIILV